MVAGVSNLALCFVLVDTQIVNESMLEDVCGVLNSGDVTNLYGEKEMEEIVSACKIECI
jgi:dynein heavy chain